ncbi:magnesium transporter [Thermocrispum sp.]|uniref:Magnesium transporter n=1 Tax=Thermocrispum agreste TaxID=37925 RepID=A0ABD6FIK2_9PSEU|nr:magnesium transporter [Thermocrispum sp.]
MTGLLVTVALVAAVAAVRAARRAARTGTPRSRALVVVIAILAFNVVLGATPAMAQQCGEPPNPERPGTGMVGALDSAEARGEKGSAYRDYGYAGMVWHVYQTDCGPLSGVTDANTTLDTWAGNQLFNVAKVIVGATNGLHYTVMEGGLFDPIYKAIEKGTEAVYNNIYVQFFGLAALLLAIWLFRHIWNGDLATVSKKALFAIGAVWLASSSFALLSYIDDVDRAIVRTTTGIQAGFVDESEERVVRHVLPTNLHREIVYKNWLRGEFGKVDSREARKHGRALLDAQAFTWREMARGDDGDEAVIRQKNAEFKRVANDLGPAAGYFTGEDGSRTGAGFIALLQSMAYSLFQLLAKAAVLLAQVLIRLLTLTAPLLGLIAILHHDTLRKVGKVVGTVAFNLVVLSVLAGIHALLLNAIFAASGTLSMLTQVAIAGIVTILMFVVGRPVRRLWQMVDVTTRAVGSALPASPGLLSRFRRKPDGPSPQDEFWQNVRAMDDTSVEAPGALGTATASGRRLRPEGGGQMITATAQRLDGRKALPAAGTPDAARMAFTGPPTGGSAQQVRAALPQAPRRPDVTTAWEPRIPSQPVSRGYLDAEQVVVPSRILGASSANGYQPEAQAPQVEPPRRQAQPYVSAAAAMSPPDRPEPRRVDPELVNGKPVYVLYRPSRGLEVRQAVRDTDAVVR